MKRGSRYSVYGSSQQGQRWPRGRASHRAAIPSLRMVSPRKRKRSPDSPESEGCGGARGSGLAAEGDAGLAKISRGATFDDSDDDDDDLDRLGNAALEDFEMTQRARESALTCDQQGPTPYQQPSSSPPVPPGPAPVHVGSGDFNSTRGIASLPSSTSGPWGEGGGLEQRLKLLQEENYTKDGEVKLLRGEKERLSSEMRKKDEQIVEIQKRLSSENRDIEQQLSKEKESLATRLKFMDQEMAMLRDKCTLLEQKVKSPTPSSHLPSPVSASALTPSQLPRQPRQTRTDVEFLSTETFMPLSKMGSSEVAPVHVSSKKSLKAKQPQNSDEVSAKSGKGHVSSGRSDVPRSVGKKEQSKSSAVTALREGNHETQRRRESVSRVSGGTSQKQSVKECPIALNVPCRELSSTQLLMLLVQRNLLKVPKFPREGTADEESKSGEGGPSDLPPSDLTSPAISTSESESSTDPPPKLTGLLSLLHLPSQLQQQQQRLQQPTSRSLFSSATTSPSSSQSPSSPSSSPIGPLQLLPALDSSSESLPQTPARKQKLHPPKAFTCARSDFSRVMKPRHISDVKKSFSTANTPVCEPLSPFSSLYKTSSLVDSINAGGLERGIVSLLRSADYSELSLSFRTNPNVSIASVTPFLSTSSSLTSDDSIVSLLSHIGDIIVCYYDDRTGKSQTPGIASDLSETLDFASPKSSLNSSTTTASRNSNPPSQSDQELVAQALGLLETLVTYCRRVREHLLSKPPPFTLDSRSSSALGDHLEENTNGDSMIVDNLTQLPQLAMSPLVTSMKAGGQRSSDADSHPSPQRKTWKGTHLVKFGGALSSEVWIPADQGVTASAEPWSTTRIPQDWPSASTISKDFQTLFSTIVELTSPRWLESVENTVVCLNILARLAEDCEPDFLTRFSPFFMDDFVGCCLDREDPRITLSIVTLLQHVVRSPDILNLLCLSQGDSCILFMLWHYFLEPPSTDDDIIYQIHSQLVRFISITITATGGPAVLFESTSCLCSLELLNSLVRLLCRMVQDIHHQDLTARNLALIGEILSLLHKISLYDRDFDRHWELCEHAFIFSLNTLSSFYRAKGLDHEAMIVRELLELAEEEDSQDVSSGEELEEKMEM